MSYIGNKEIVKVFIGNKEVTDIFAGNNKVYSSGPNVDPILENNDWATIRSVCEAGLAADYWAIGDTKTDVGTDGNTRTFQIVDMSGMYGKHVVFMQVELESTGYVWDADSSNDYNVSDMRVTHLPSIMAKYSSALQENLNDTTYKVAENGSSATILDLTDKLFLPAEKEIFGSSALYSRNEERAVLSQYQYYAINTAASYRQKTKIGASLPSIWWERSPRSGGTQYACLVTNNGNMDNSGAGFSYGVAPCFSF